jgi:hypothetical protein
LAYVYVCGPRTWSWCDHTVQVCMRYLTYYIHRLLRLFGYPSPRASTSVPRPRACSTPRHNLHVTLLPHAIYTQEKCCPVISIHKPHLARLPALSPTACKMRCHPAGVWAMLHGEQNMPLPRFSKGWSHPRRSGRTSTASPEPSSDIAARRCRTFRPLSSRI